MKLVPLLDFVVMEGTEAFFSSIYLFIYTSHGMKYKRVKDPIVKQIPNGAKMKVMIWIKLW